jgi:hypothetical protein
MEKKTPKSEEGTQGRKREKRERERERERDDVRGQNDRPLFHVSVSSTTGLPHHQPLASDLWV